MKIGEKIKELRIDNHLTQKQLAEKLNISQSSICEWERNQYEPTATAIKLLTSFFNISADFLLGLEDEFGNIQGKSTLTYREQKLLSAINELDDSLKDKIIEDCEYFANKNKKQSQRRA